MIKLRLIAALGAALAMHGTAKGELVHVYIGIDGREILPSGVYSGLPNPNYGRLTLLYAHAYPYIPGAQPPGQPNFLTSHYHAIGAYSYTGPAASPQTNNTSANDRLPERATQQPPLTLVPGTELYAGKLVNDKTQEHFSNPRWRSVWDINKPDVYGPGSPEWVMFHSSGGTRTNSLAGSDVALELISKTEGLNIGSPTETSILSDPGDQYSLGDGNEIDFRPVFWVEGDAPAGTYSASFKLVDLSTEGGRTPFLESGIFSFDFQVAGAPELSIKKSITLTMPLVAPGYVLEGAPSVDGPWTAVPIPARLPDGHARALTLDVDEAMQVFRFRKE